MIDGRTLEHEAAIEIGRRQLRSMQKDDLLALADHMLVTCHSQERMLRNAMRRVAELEVGRALMDHEVAARALQGEHQLLARVGQRLTGWWSRLWR